MTLAEALKLSPGMRVVHKPTGELGTCVRLETYKRVYYNTPNRRAFRGNLVLLAVIVNPDEPVWLKQIAYYPEVACGRKIMHLALV